MKKINSRKGFTLIELVVVVSILVILATIAVPVVKSIVNKASKDSIMSNEQAIELAIKECQADIIIRNDETYNGLINYQTVSGTQRTIPKISTSHNQINIEDVAIAKSITGAFSSVTYNGDEFIPYWNKATDKCVFATYSGVGVSAIGKDISGNTVTLSQCVPLTKMSGRGSTATRIIDSNIKVDGL